MSKKGIRKRVSVLIIGALLIMNGSAGYAEQGNDVWFSDTNGHWAKDIIKEVVALNIMVGESENEFKPDGTLTRAMAITAIYRMVKPEASKTEIRFNDVSLNSWYSEAVSWGSKANIIQGYGGYFRPNEEITREQLACIIQRVLDYKNVKITIVDKLSSTDIEDISEWAISSVESMACLRIMVGNELGQIRPKDTATRAEAAKMFIGLNRIINSGENEKIEI